MEADLVAHYGGSVHGTFLNTLVLTDIATGWTECLPLLYRSQEEVLHALERAENEFSRAAVHTVPGVESAIQQGDVGLSLSLEQANEYALAGPADE